MDHQPTFRSVIGAFLRRRMLFLMVCCFVCLAGGLYLLIKQPLYMSEAALVMHFDSQLVPDIDRTRTPSQLQGSNEHREILYSDADILRSPDLIREVVEKIGVSRLFPAIAATSRDNSRKVDEAVRQFTSDLVVDVGLQSDVLNLSFLNANATVARDALQQLINQFYAREAEVYANPQLQFAEQEASGAKDKLAAAQTALAEFKAHNKIADLQQQISQLIGSRTDVESRLQVAQGRVLEAEQRQQALKDLLDSIPAKITTTATGEQYRAVDEAEAKLDELRAKRNEMASNYLPGSEVFKRLDAQIASLSAAAKTRTSEARGRSATQPNVVYENIKTDYLRAVAEATSARQPRDVLTAQLAQINQQLGALDAERNKHDDLQRAVQIQNDTYRSLAIRFETARFEANRNAQKISAAVLISAPKVPHVPARPRRKLVALATAVAALMAGIASVLLVEGVDDCVRTPNDVRRILRLPVLATFPRDA